MGSRFRIRLKGESATLKLESQTLMRSQFVAIDDSRIAKRTSRTRSRLARRARRLDAEKLASAKSSRLIELPLHRPTAWIASKLSDLEPNLA